MNSSPQKILAVAPMMAWTDTHCRVLHRLFSPNALLFTEMITTGAILNGSPKRLLRRHPSESPVACQIGGNDPAELANAAQLVEAAGFEEVNLNVGCPSEAVQLGRFGACLMAHPKLVSEAVQRMRDSVTIPVTVKCRLGIDQHDSESFLQAFIGTVHEGGCQTFYVHARKAILNGFSPAQNRNIPPLHPQRVYNLKRHFPGLTIVLNGGVTDVQTAKAHLDHVDGIMIGRAAYHNPRFVGELESCMFGTKSIDELGTFEAYLEYIDAQLMTGTRLFDMSKHLIGMFGGHRGARRYRRLLSDATRRKSNDAAVVREAVTYICRTAA